MEQLLPSYLTMANIPYSVVTNAVGKQVLFTIAHNLPSNDDTERAIGSVEVGGVDVASQLLKAGWAKLKELKREATEAERNDQDASKLRVTRAGRSPITSTK